MNFPAEKVFDVMMRSYWEMQEEVRAAPSFGPGSRRKYKWIRRKPYTEIGIKRMRCFRCQKQAHTQWQICADGNQWRPICVMCDIDLNRLVLEFMRDPDVELKMAIYASKMLKPILKEGMESMGIVHDGVVGGESP